MLLSILKNKMIRLFLYILNAFLVSLFPLFVQGKGTESSFQTVAFLRVKNEIKTIEACLNSIDGVFNRIVIIHSNEPDDGSVAVMQKWCSKRKNCEIHEYPYTVIPPHDKRYATNQFQRENSLASYYNFGLSFFKPHEWVVKIDGDQIYLTQTLKKTLAFIEQNHQIFEKTLFGIKGYNTCPYRGKIIKYRIEENGGKDSFIVRRDKIKEFAQNSFYETLQVQDIQNYHVFDEPHWFHFLKTLKHAGQVRSVDEAKANERVQLNKTEQDLFDQKIRPLLKESNSPYADLIF